MIAENTYDYCTQFIQLSYGTKFPFRAQYLYNPLMGKWFSGRVTHNRMVKFAEVCQAHDGHREVSGKNSHGEEILKFMSI